MRLSSSELRRLEAALIRLHSDGAKGTLYQVSAAHVSLVCFAHTQRLNTHITMVESFLAASSFQLLILIDRTCTEALR